MVVNLFLMLLSLIFSGIPMNCFINDETVDPSSGSIADKIWSKWLEYFSSKGFRVYHYYQYIGSKKLRKTWFRNFLITWVLGSILGSLSVFWYMNSLTLEKRREILASMCEERAMMLQDQFNVSMNHLQSLAILVSTFHHAKNPSAIDQATFTEYTERTAFERPLTSGVAYAVKVLHPEREQFEKQQGWTIKRMDTEEQSPVREDDYGAETHEVSPVQEEYAPVIFAQDTVSHVISFDMLSGKEDRENVIRARASGKGVLTAPFRLLKSKRLGVILTFAVYESKLSSNALPNERIQATDGYLGGIFDIESLVEKLLHQLASKQSILVNVYDTTNTSDPISMYGQNVTDNAVHHVCTLSFGDPFRKHEMHCRFKQKRSLPILEVTTSFGILVIALLLGYIFYATMSRIAKVEDDFLEMMELKKRAEAAGVAKSQFLATVSHEIRTPMNGVLGMLQMLMETDLDITQQDYVRTAQASGKDLVSLINEVLDQAKIESGKLELEAVQFNVRTVMDDVLSLFSGKSQDKGIELAVYISDQIPDILVGDPGRLRQIITNLMGNSIKFTDKGHIFVTAHLIEEVMNPDELETEISSTNTLSGFPVADKRLSWENFQTFNQDGPLFQQRFSSTSPNLINLIISVEDTGLGIPRESQSHVFTPFMQVDPSISRIHGGTGIGLSISKCLVGLMNGEIGFVSEPHVGSTFTFTAVFSDGSASSDESKNSNSQYELLSSEFEGMKALVVDTRPVRSKVTKYHLQRLRIHVDVLSDLKQALSIITSETETGVIHMIFIETEVWFQCTDLLPSLVYKLRKDSLLDVPKLFLLANSISSTKAYTNKAGGYMPPVIMKPLRASMLAASLQRAMGVGIKRNFPNGEVPLSPLQNILQGKQVLVVDDNLVNLKVAEGALKKYGAQVSCAESGKKAIVMLKPPHNFDACFMDIQMPEMDGFEATRRIRDMEHEVNDQIQHGEVSVEAYKKVSHWHIYILAMTADVIEATRDKCLKSGMDGYVTKPIEGEKLYSEVTRFFEITTKCK